MRVLLLLTIIFIEPAAMPAQVDSSAVAGKQYSREIRELAGKKKIRQAFEAIDALEPSTRKHLIHITEIPAPPFKEDKRANAYQELLSEREVDSVWMDAEGNVLALRRGATGKKTVALNAHLDTVFPEGTDVTVRVEGDTLYAPGIGDDSRGLAMILTLLDAMDRSGIRTEADLLVVATVGEEGLGDLRGVKHVFREGGPKIDSWIAIDGGSLENITSKALGSLRYRISIHGPGGHSWAAFGLGNPHHAAARAMDRFVSAAREYTKTGPRTSYNIGRVGGGTSVNAIPFESWMEIDMRSESPERLLGIDSLMVHHFREGLADYNRSLRTGPPMTLDFEKIGDRPSGETPDEAPLVQRAIAAGSHMGVSPVLGRSSTDSNIPIARGIPAITLGRGGQGGATHSLGEWWMNDATGPLALKRTLLVVIAEAGLAN